MAADYVLAKLPYRLPAPTIGENVNAKEIAQAFVSRLAALSPDDLSTDALWRDVFAFTGSLRTFYGASQIVASWRQLTQRRGLADTSVELITESACVVRIDTKSTWIDAVYNLTTTNPPASCKAVLSLVLTEEGKWHLWTLRTILDQINEYPNVDRLEQEKELRTQQNADANTHFDCVVVGSGHAGLSVAGRLKALNLSYVVLDNQTSVGGSWEERYDALKMHLTRDASHLPLGTTYPSTEYGKFLNRNEVAQGHRAWVEKFDINLRLSATLHSGRWDPQENRWTLSITNSTGPHLQTITAAHVVMATGAGGQIPNMPEVPGLSDFRGVMFHSANFKSAIPWHGKKAVVVGSGNSAHDIAEDMVTAGCSSVTMVQRSPTFVFRSTDFTDDLDLWYNEYVPTDLADMLYVTRPHPLSRLLSNHALHQKAKLDSDRYDALEKTGFKLIREGDITYQLLECFGGFYMDVGATNKIIDGSIKVKSDSQIDRFGPNGLTFSDGSGLDADLVVFATGFEFNAKTVINKIFGDSIANQAGDYWGLDDEGELRGVFKPSGHPHLWMIGGSTYQTRYFSRFIALHICAAINGKPLEIYGD